MVTFNFHFPIVPGLVDCYHRIALSRAFFKNIVCHVYRTRDNHTSYLASLFTNQGTPEGDIPKCFVPDIPGLSRILGTLVGDIPEVLMMLMVFDHVRIEYEIFGEGSHISTNQKL